MTKSVKILERNQLLLISSTVENCGKAVAINKPDRGTDRHSTPAVETRILIDESDGRDV